MGTTLGILHMNQTLAAMEQFKQDQADQLFNSLPKAENPEPICYWWIERQSKRDAEVWIFVTAFWSTESRATEHYNGKYGKRTDYTFRLRKIDLNK